MKPSLPLWAAAAAAAVLPTALAAGCFGEGAPFHPNDWQYCQPVTDTLYMYYTPLEDTVMLGLHALEGASGWTALGPAGNGGMKGASQIVVRKDEAGAWMAEDRHSFDYVTPSMDEQQDVQLLFAEQDEETGETAWGVVIPQDACDEPYDYALEDRNIFMIWAMGSGHDFAFHGNRRGQFTANMMSAPPTVPDLEQYDYVDLTMPNVEVVRGEPELDPANPFICTYFDKQVLAQELGFDADDEIHMVGVEPLVDPGNEKILHHMILFTCVGDVGLGAFDGGLDDSDLYHNKVITSCTNMPPGCNEYTAQWAVGAPALVLPENVGIPMNEGHRWLVMQTHYYNPDMTPGLYDSSGLRIRLTTQLRPIDAGIMIFPVGVAPGQHPPLPGGMADVAMETMYVEPECTMLWKEPLNIIDVSHHSHFMGLHQELVVERDGRNLGPMRKEFRFDYNHQSAIEPVKALQQLLPGDRIAASCRFDTSSVPADSEVLIGENSNNEMCFPTLYYYPKQDLQTFFYFPPETISQVLVGQDHTMCFQPPTDEKFGSLCHEMLYTDFVGFNKYVFDMFGYSGPSFTYDQMCNSGALTEQLRNDGIFGWDELCPACQNTQTCTEEEILPIVEDHCKKNCQTMGLSYYPDTTRTEPYTTANFGCPNILFDPPVMAEPEACQVKGSLPVTIELKTATEEPAPATGEPEGVSGGATVALTSLVLLPSLAVLFA